MKSLKFKFKSGREADIPAWLIICTVITGVSIFLVIFNDLTFIEIYKFVSGAWKENVKR